MILPETKNKLVSKNTCARKTAKMIASHHDNTTMFPTNIGFVELSQEQFHQVIDLTTINI